MPTEVLTLKYTKAKFDSFFGYLSSGHQVLEGL